jgi:hypothetical protein
MVKGDTLEIPSLPEESGLSESKSVPWVTNKIIGRSPIFGFSHSEPSDIGVSFQIHASVEQGDGGSLKDVQDVCNWLRSLAYPDYDTAVARPPHRCRVQFGNVVRDVVLTSVRIVYVPPFDPQTGLAHGAKVSLSFKEIEDIPQGYADVRT